MSTGRVVTILAIAVSAWLGAGAAAAQPASARSAGEFESRLDRLVRLGDERPQMALGGLASIAVSGPAQLRQRLFAQAAVLARAGRDQAARMAADELRLLDTTQHGTLGRAASEVVLALLSESQGRPDLADPHARAALDALGDGCAAPPPAVPLAQPTPPTPPAPTRPACDLRVQWQAQMLALRAAAARDAAVPARAAASAALLSAARLGDPWRQALTAGALASLASHRGDNDEAQAWIAEAQKWAAGDSELLARLALSEAVVASGAADQLGAKSATERGLERARAADLKRLQALLWVNLSDHELQARRPAAALAAAEQALPVMRRFGDLRAERTLLHNRGLAKIGLGRLAEGRRDVEAALAMWQKTGAQADSAAALREYGQALAQAGDVAGALELFHRERAMAAETKAANRKAALAELDQRYQPDSQQREIELRGRDNAVQAQTLANRERMKWVWALLAAVALLAAGVIGVLLKHMRDTQRELRSRQAALRVQSECDALTGLANRRQFQHVMHEQAAAGAGPGYAGSLLIVDIDHFKHINDDHGHAVGDTVLKEVARRLLGAVRDGDLVARWGGEEFLIHAADVGADQVDALAERVLHGIGGQPFKAGSKSLRVTASIGYGCFPLPPKAVALGWEQALNLADMALYSAKSQGRNRALGLGRCSARSAAEIAEIEADFESAWHRGAVTLARVLGPDEPPAGLRQVA